MNESQPEGLATGQRVALRETLPSDLDTFIRWFSQGEWREFDAPWEIPPPLETEEALAKFRDRFLRRCKDDPTHPRKRATIMMIGGEPLGWVNRYGPDRFPDAWNVGIDICEDTYLNHGLGTEALELWIDYLFEHSKIHRIGFDTWSFNARVIRVAGKLGVSYEGRRREMIEWKGEWIDRLHFGVLRADWEKRSSGC